MKAKKDGRYLNCYIDRKLLDEFEVVCDILGKTKTKVLEEAMQSVVSPYYQQDSQVLCVTDGYYLDGIDKHSQDVRYPITKVPCKILDHHDVLGQPYVKIWKNGQVVSVPISFIEE